MVDVKSPSVVLMGMSFLAQSLVVAIVGLNMGLRKSNLDQWKVYFLKRKLGGAAVKSAVSSGASASGGSATDYVSDDSDDRYGTLKS